jgi:hypothetical protein
LLLDIVDIPSAPAVGARRVLYRTTQISCQHGFGAYTHHIYPEVVHMVMIGVQYEWGWKDPVMRDSQCHALITENILNPNMRNFAARLADDCV